MSALYLFITKFHVHNYCNWKHSKTIIKKLVSIFTVGGELRKFFGDKIFHMRLDEQSV